MKQIFVLVTLAALALGSKVPVDHVPVPTVVPIVDNVKVTTPVPVVTTHKNHLVNHGPHVPPHVPSHVQNVVQQVHQHVPQVVNHHVGTKKDAVVPHVPQVPHAPHVPNVISSGVVVAVTPIGVPHASDKVPKPNQHHVHVDVIHHHADGHKHVAHNVPNVVAGVDGVTPVVGGVQHQHHSVPQAVVDKVNKVEQHIQQVMQQAHQHIPQVINHHIAQEQQKHKEHDHHSTTTTHVPHSMHAVGEKVPHVTPAPVVHHPVVTVKTTTT